MDVQLSWTSWEVGKKTAVDPQKIAQKNLKFGRFSCFFPQNLGNFRDFTLLGKENPKLSALRAIFGQYLMLLLSRRQKTWKEKQISQVPKVGKETGFGARILTGVTGTNYLLFLAPPGELYNRVWWWWWRG